MRHAARAHSLDDRSPGRRAQAAYGADALGALAVGFAVAGALASPLRRLRSVNGAAALGCGLTSAGLRVLARGWTLPFPQEIELETKPSISTIAYSIVIPVFNRPQLLAKLLACLSAQAESWKDLGRGEIVIVDDGSVDDTARVADGLARSMPIPTRVVSIPHAGPGCARNAGFAAARGLIGVSIDSDCLPDEGWLPGLLSALRAEPKTVAFARIRSSAKFAYPIENVPDCKGFVSASFALDRAAFCKLGGFHPEYGMSHEDLDLVEVVKGAGYRVVRADSQVYHPLRHETARSIWRVGLNSKYANLFALRHGSRARGLTRATPYYFFGVAGNYGSSVALLAALTNIVATVAFALTDKSFAAGELKGAGAGFAAAAALYALALAALGLRVGAGVKRLPRYVTTLASFQVATLVGRLQGSLEYGVPLL